MSAAPIAKRLIAKMNQVRTGRLAKVTGLLKAPLLGSEGLEPDPFHPAHEAHVEVQNRLGDIVSCISDMSELARLWDLLAGAEDEYGPQGPPMSPLTVSYFQSWLLFDACVPKTTVTLTGIILELGAITGMDFELARLARMQSQSRLGFYLHQGIKDGLSILEELVTGNVCQALVPAGHPGQQGELWLVRIFPPPFPGTVEHVVANTPYVVIDPPVQSWLAYFNRTLPQPLQATDYKRHMKFPPTWNYWHEYVFEAYVNHRREVIFLQGLPDDAKSRPHSRVNSGF